MQDSVKPKSEIDEKSGDLPTETWADDQKQHSYYYDDAHGYQAFDPADDDEADEQADQDEPDGDINLR